MNLISGYMLINKSIPSTGGPYTVRFYDDEGELIQTDANVPQYGRASCTLLDGTFNDDLEYFKGWNPAPDSVTRDMDCYPVYGDYIVSHEEIHDSWETICADKGAHYPLGAYKSLVIDSFPIHHYDGDKVKYYASSSGDMTEITFNIGNGYADLGFYSISLDMVKVAEGEDGSTSSWLSTGCVKWSTEQRWIWTDRTSTTTGYNPNTMYQIVYTDWGSSLLRQYMQEEFLSSFPAVLQANIKAVNKSYTSFARTPSLFDIYLPSQRVVEKTSTDRIWVPSLKELHTMTNGLQTNGFPLEESLGIDYSAVYVPNYSSTAQDSRITIRSAAYYSQWMYSTVLRYYNGSLSTKEYGAARAVPFGFCL